MISNFYSDSLGKEFQFIMDNENDNNNAFTIIVGKNGVGKSRLLNDVINAHLSNKKESVKSAFPTKIIAVSTSVFDRFPLLNRPRASTSISNHFYVYSGVRSQFGSGVMKLINSVGGALVNNFLNSIETDRENTAQIFNFLEFKDEFSLAFRIHHYRIKNLMEQLNENNDEVIRLGGLVELVWSRKEAEEMIVCLEEISNYFLFSDVFEKRSDIRWILDFDNSKKKCSVKGVEVEDVILTKLLKLVNLNIVSIFDVNILKKKIGSVSLKRASSGEQCMFSTLFSIAGSIKDGALVVIDEPEISLHPEWQEKYIEILSEVFSHYQGCHFIIASHSPQIISRLKSKNSYVLSLHLNKLFNAEHFVKKSSDFLLAEIFDSPGYKNEYITRVALNVFAKVKSKKIFDHDDVIAINKLKEFKVYLEKEDPVYELITSLEEMYDFYS
ncbi:ATP-binding protein [Enterobacter sp. MF024]|uniref:ATP-binding protein n=1 Tax=Enterobacter sp. MF024 TaxID=2555644 RepID=UPI001484DE19|nr:ATP-binding protein [Enterobacter sp. MF024]